MRCRSTPASRRSRTSRAPAERAEVPHHLVGYLPLTASSSVGAHAPLAQAAIDDARPARGRAAARGRRDGPLPASGAGLELALPPSVPAAERARWERFYDERGADQAFAELQRPRRARGRAAARERPTVRRARPRARRAGASLAPEPRQALGQRGCGGRRSWPSSPWPRAELRARIAARTEAMLAGGAVDEVRAVRDARCRALARRRRASSGWRASAPTSRVCAHSPTSAAEITLRTGRVRPPPGHLGRVGSRRPSSSQAPTARSATPTACWS